MRSTEALPPDPDRTISHTPAAPPSADPLPAWLVPGGEPLSGYTLVKKLGAGGFGQVWAANGPGRIAVALKFVCLSAAGRIERSALDLIKHIRHPYLLVLFGAWERDGWLIIGMECADESLAERLTTVQKAGLVGIPRNDLKRYLIDVAEVLDFLNKPRHFIDGPKPVALHHGDVKPHNLLRHGTHVKLSDFGLVRVLGTPTPGAGLTPAYAAPEVFEGKPTRWSDQYALAIAYCEMRGGKRPTRTDQGFDLSMVPEAERPIIERALAPKPRDRWPSCRHFVRELTRVYAVMADEPVMSFRTLGRVRGEPPPFVAPADSQVQLGEMAPTRSGGMFWQGNNPQQGRSPVVAGIVVGLLVGGALWLMGMHWAWLFLAGVGGLVASRLRRTHAVETVTNQPIYTPWSDAPQLTTISTPPADSEAFDDSLLVDVIRQPSPVVIDREPLLIQHVLEGHRDAVWGVALSADGQTLVSASMDQTIRVWDVHSGRERFVLEGHREGVTAVAVVDQTAYSAGIDGTVRFWDLTTGTIRVTGRHSSRKLLTVAVTPDGQRIFAAGEEGLIHEFNDAGACVRHIQGPHGWITSLTINRAGTELAAGTIDGHVWVMDIRNWQTLRHIIPEVIPSGVRSLAFSPAGTVLLVGREDGNILVVMASESSTATKIVAHRDWVRGMAFSDDGKRVLTVSDDETSHVYSMIDDMPGQRQEWPALDESMLACAWSQETIAIAGESGRIHVVVVAK